MQEIIESAHPLGLIEELFPCMNDDGQGVQVSEQAQTMAENLLGEAVTRWHTPDVFSIRYGSRYVATAWGSQGQRVRFLIADAGNFQEGDDHE